MKPDDIVLIMYWSALIATLIALTLASLNIIAAQKARQQPRKVIARLRCPKCGHIAEREFRPGDYVGKTDEPCPKCGTRMYIDAIYVEIIKQKRKLAIPLKTRKE